MGIKDAVEEDDEVVSYAEPSRGIYKKLIVRNDRLAGAILIGDGAVVPVDAPGVCRGAAAHRDALRAALHRPFSPRPAPPSAESMADDTQICDCNGVSKAQIVEAVLARREQPAGGLRRHPRRHRLRHLPSRGRADRRAGLSGAGRAGAARHRPRRRRRRCWCRAAAAPQIVVTLNKIERIKKEKDGLDIVADVPRIAGGGWQAINDADRERLKWAGVFFRRQTPGRFMMRLRIANGLTNADQLRDPRRRQRGVRHRRSSTSRPGSRCRCAASPSSTCRRSGAGSKRSACCRCRPAWTTSATSSAAPRPA